MSTHDSPPRDEPLGSPDSRVIDCECPQCGEPLEVVDSMVGRFDTCPECGSIFTVPKPAVSLALVWVIILAIVIVIAFAVAVFLTVRR